MSALSGPTGRPPMTVAEFLAYDDGTDTRHELVDGEPVAMNPPAARHVVICHNIGRSLERQLRPPCQAFWAGGGVALGEAEKNWRQPDVLVTCVRPTKGFFLDPRLVVEVLSPSTERDDRTVKLDFYESLPSIEAILLVWQDGRRVRLRTRGEGAGWRDEDTVGAGTVRVPSLGVELALDEIYHDPWGEAEGAGP
jgi:Uma2 family endonuclease